MKKLFAILVSVLLIGVCATPDACAQKRARKSQKKVTTTKKETKKSTTIASNTQTYTVNGVTFKMVEVDGGTFMMGATKEQINDAFEEEKPAHKVTVTSFSIGQTEVTQKLWQAVMGYNPSVYGTANCPVGNVSWYECQEFIEKLNKLTGEEFRLPLEAEWEFAARGGNKSHGYKYSGSNSISSVAWYYDNTSSCREVATKRPNELGIYDMSGSVWEWCDDYFDENYYSFSDSTDPTGPDSGSHNVIRGGDWDDASEYCRVASRQGYTPNSKEPQLGFRLAQ